MPAQDGAGWLLRLYPDACTVLLVLELLLIVRCLLCLSRARFRQLCGEEKILLLFVGVTLLPAVAALIGIAAWFASVSVWVGVGAAMSFYLCSVAFMLRD
ncbi:MAG: hypothetical protein K2W95_29705 [Candidatus Obscuribacterales bacterium]|nr:hypothetical protein [Candidatus Obscuribacterales bacterium]